MFFFTAALRASPNGCYAPLIESMLEMDPEKRLNSAGVLAWLQNVRAGAVQQVLKDAQHVIVLY